MKSLSNKSWDLREGTEVQSWKPDEIFPSLISQDVNSVIDEMLQMFQPKPDKAVKADQPAAVNPVEKPAKKKADVRKWRLEELESVSAKDQAQQVSIPGLQGTPLNLALDDNQRLLAEAKKQAEEIIHIAQNTAKEMILQAQQDAEQIHREAYENGRTEGIAGLQKANTNAQFIVDEIVSWRQELVRHSDILLADMVDKIARLMFGEGVQLGNEILQQNLNKVMKMAESLGDLRIYLNPQDAHILDPEWRRFQETLTGRKVQIIPSDTVLPGGCYVQGEMGIVDARIETQLQAVLGVIEQERQKSEDELS